MNERQQHHRETAAPHTMKELTTITLYAPLAFLLLAILAQIISKKRTRTNVHKATNKRPKYILRK